MIGGGVCGRARLESVTVSGGYASYDAAQGINFYGCGVRVAKALYYTGSPAAADLLGAGGVVSNCVFTGNTVSYKHCSAIVYVNGPADKALVTCCTVRNNSCSRQTDCNNGANSIGSIVHVDSGRFTSSIVRDNTHTTTGEGSRSNDPAIVTARGGSVEGCLVYGNTLSRSYDPTVIRTVATGKIVNTIAANNTINLESWSRKDRTAASPYWEGVDSGFSNCVAKATDIPVPNDSCFSTNNLYWFDEANLDFRVRRLSPLRRAGRTTGVITTGKDLLGYPRVQEEGYVDIGPIAYNPTVKWVTGSCDANGNFEGLESSFHVTNDEGYGDEPTYYWTLNGTGYDNYTFVTKSPDLNAVLTRGFYDVTLSVSNLTEGTGESYALENVHAHQYRFYVKAGNAGAAAPYETEETASADIQKAIDAVTHDGAEVYVMKGTYKIASNIFVRTRPIVLRGATGNPEDVVVRNTNTVKWAQSSQHGEGEYGHGEGRCCVLDAGPAARIESMTFENGRGVYASEAGCGLLLASWANRSVWPQEGKGGVVSNCIVRSCSSGGSNKYGVAPGICACGSNYLITHTVVSNCTACGGNVNGGKFAGVGLDLSGGARAENCLVSGNKTSVLGAGDHPEYGRGTVGGVMVRDNSVLRFSTVVGNNGATVGGVNVNGTSARIENCIVLGNWLVGDALYYKNWEGGDADYFAAATNRFKSWAMISLATSSDIITEGTTWGGGTPYKLSTNEMAYVTAHPEAVDAAFRNTVTDYAAAGETGTQSTSAETFRKVSKYGYRLGVKSPACDAAAATTAMPPTDLSGAPRLTGRGYDIGCYERPYTGMMLYVR